MKSSQFKRLGKEDLLEAEPVGTAHKQGIDLLHVSGLANGMQLLTPFARRNYGRPPWHPHVYTGYKHIKLESIHAGLCEKTPGGGELPKITHDLLWAAYGLEHGSLASGIGLGAEVDRIAAEYTDAEETHRNKVAGHLTQVIQRRDVFVFARDTHDPGDDPNIRYFGGKVVRLANLRNEKDGMQFEPVIKTSSGVGLLPLQMYIFQGLYVPAVNQVVE